MIHRTEAIVLRSFKYQEHSLLCTLLTQRFGRRQFIVPAAFSRRGKSKHVYFQALSILDVVYYEKPHREFNKITECTFAELFQTAHTQPLKLNYILFLSEFLTHVLQEEVENSALYSTLRDFLLAFDTAHNHLYDRVIRLMLNMTRPLGCYPSLHINPDAGGVVFDIASGALVSTPVQSEDRSAGWVTRFLCEMEHLEVPRSERKQLMQILLAYYRRQVVDFPDLRTLPVLEETFR